jgi:YVTN family beta-propeller protein
MRSRLTTLGIAGASVIALGLGAAARRPLLRLAHITHPVTGQALTVPGKDGSATLLFNGWKITPAGRHIPTGDFLLGGAISPDGKTLAICNAGYDKHTLHIVDIATEKEIAKLPVAHTWNGLAWSPDGKKIYVGGGASIAGSDIYTFENANGTWTEGKPLKLTGNDSKNTVVAGIALSSDGKTLYAVNNSDNKLYILDAGTGEGKSSLTVGDHPYVCALVGDGSLVGITCLGGKEAVAVSVSDPTKPTLAGRADTGAHPNAVATSTDGRVFISCGNEDAVYAYDLMTGKLAEKISTRLAPDAPSGSTPNAVAIAPDNKTLYVANADNNDVAVIDIATPGSSRIKGFLPTGWYPTALHVSPDGKKIIIGTGKGIGSHPNPGTVKPANPVAPADYKSEYIGLQLNGLISFVDAPTDAQLATYTAQVYANTPGQVTKTAQLEARMPSAVPDKPGDKSPIKHILYIIKENRTYDQVFGDLKQGNGDPGLTLFGREVSPNHHALAEQFVLLDNIYCNGEVSVDGHQWCDAGIVTDFEQKAWVYSYSGKGRLKETSEVSEPNSGYLWDACNKKGLTYRSYGESFYANSSEAAPVPTESATTSLIGHGSAKFVGVGWPKGKQMRDTDKADVFLSEFAAYEKTNSLPNFMVMSLGEDHTRGTTPGEFTPKAAVASNDQALGKIVDGITHSKYWKDTAIFVIEDDAQNGPDHVDSHRTVALIISPYTKRGYVDSTMYSTASMLRTMERFLGLSPLTQYDAAATPMTASFTNRADLRPYTLLPPQTDLMAKNTNAVFGANQSRKMDFTAYDHADENALNRILWHSIKGVNTPYPATVRAFLSGNSRTSTPSKSGDTD